MSQIKQTISLTFGDCGENHVGMEKVGKLVNKGMGFNIQDLKKYMEIMQSLGLECSVHNLKEQIQNDVNESIYTNIEDAYVLVIRKGLNKLLEKNSKTLEQFKTQLNSFEWDRKYYCNRRKKVLNKHARANVCFGETSCEPDYENKKGRIIGYSDIDCLRIIKENIEEILGDKCKNMICEGNKYFDLKKCGIGHHGDAERRKVIAFRLGETMKLHFTWFFKSKHIGKTLELSLDDGDMYIMSEKAVGNDWKRRNIYTLRHAAGIDGCKYLELKH